MLIRGNLYSTNFSMCEEKTLAMMEQISIDIDIDKMSIQHRHQVQASRNWDWDESRLELGRFEDLAWFAYRNTNNRGRHGEPGRCSIDRMVGKGGLAVRVDDGVNPRWGIDSSKASVTQQHQTSKLHHSGARRLAIERCCSHVTARSGEQSFCLAPVVPGFKDLQIRFVYLDASTRLLGFPHNSEDTGGQGAAPLWQLTPSRQARVV